MSTTVARRTMAVAAALAVAVTPTLAFQPLGGVRATASVRRAAVAMGTPAAWTQRITPTTTGIALLPSRTCWTKTPAVEPWWTEDSPGTPMQSAPFCEGLWGWKEFPTPEVPEPAEGDNHVRVSIYNIGGAMTAVLGTTTNKQFPLIPHVGVRINGREHFFSDHVENRASVVMDQMMPPDTYPQVTFDLGVSEVGDEEIDAWLKAAETKFAPENYDLWKRNCNHFAQDFAEFLLPGTGFPQPLMVPVLDFTDSMLDNLPEWRRAMGDVFMNQLSRTVVVSWGRVLRNEKERKAEALGLDKGK